MTEEQKTNCRRWIEMLRSGEYPQIIGYLVGIALVPGKRNNLEYCYCVQGVGYLAAGYEIDTSDKELRLVNPKNKLCALNGGASLMKFSGLSAIQLSILMGLNDKENKSFKELADVIEGWIK